MTDLTEALKNGTALTYTPPPQLVAMAHDIMDGVMSGRITSLGYVKADPLGNIETSGGGIPALIYLGADKLKDDIKAAIFKPAASGIIRAG